MNKKELYNLVFGDGDKFTDFYFDKRRNKIFSYEKVLNNATVGLVSVAEVNLCKNDKSFKTALITGVCTAPNMRNKGIMNNLLNEVLNDLMSKNYQMAILSPVSKDYYKKYGFKPLICGNLVPISYLSNNEITSKKATKIDTKLLLDLYNDISKEYSLYQQITDNILLDLLDDCDMSGSEILIVYKNQLPIGWFLKDGNSIEIIVLPNCNILNNIKQLDGFTYFINDLSGKKELFQIKYLKDCTTNINVNNALIISKY